MNWPQYFMLGWGAMTLVLNLGTDAKRAPNKSSADTFVGIIVSIAFPALVQFVLYKGGFYTSLGWTP